MVCVLFALAALAAFPSAQAPVPPAPGPSQQAPPPDTASSPTAGAPVPFPEWLEGVRRDALAAGIDPETVERALSGVEPVPVVVERDRTQTEFALTIPQYLERRLTRPISKLARQKAADHRWLLERIEHTHGVPASVVLAIWALESNFGRFSGVRPTIPVLATLAHDGRRAGLFRTELIEALRILDRGDIELAAMKGSWAGAMGQPQFLPSSYIRYAQDFDGDGRRDIWHSLPDVFASIAFYLKTNGWKPGVTWGRAVKVPNAALPRISELAPPRTDGCRAARLLTQPLPLRKWHAFGVRNKDGSRLPDLDLEASLLRAEGMAFLVYSNYEALLAYNCAHSYALSVALLADQLDGRPGPYPKPARKSSSGKRSGGRRSASS